MSDDLTPLLSELAEQPDERPPPGLDDAVLAAITGRRRRSWRGPASAAAIVALAAVLLGTLLRPGPPELVLTEGRQHVEGTARLLVPGAEVAIDGAAVVVVEPGPGALRREGQEVAMDATHALAAAAGAVVTVVVMQGSAHIFPTEREAVVVQAGAQHTLRPEGAPPVAARAPEERSPPAQVDDQLGALEEEVARLRFENTVVKGQLSAHMGEPIPWPEHVSAAVSPGGFEERLAAAVAEVEGLELTELRCEEYPCMAVITGVGDEAELHGSVAAMEEALRDAIPEEDVAAMILAGIDQSDGADAVLTLSVAALDKPEDGRADPAVTERVEQRFRQATDELAGR